jgi:mannose-6-phosphate isomerase-like protein (cupin superfamily)
MFRKVFTFVVMAILLLSAVSIAQNSLDSRPLDIEKDPDIELFISNWERSIPFNTHGNMTERAIFSKLTSGDQLKPARKGEVLKFINRFSYAIIGEGDSTSPTTLKGEQEILYINSGQGFIKTKNTTAELSKGIFVLVPADCEFTITNTGGSLLTLYLICEPVPSGFRPNDDILVKDENRMTLRDSGYLTVHWSHNGKNIFTVADGLGTLEIVNFLSADAMTIGQPHSHGETIEEVWTVLEGERNLAFLGKEILWQYPGTAYKVPPTGYTPHSNINTTKEPVRFLYFARFRDHEVRK